MKGPFTIICRNHSGSRLLCEAFLQNSFWMGRCENKQRDAQEFSLKKPEVRHLIEEAFRYSELSETQKEELQETMRRLVQNCRNHCPDPESRVAYGWKRIITTFAVEIFLDAFPDGKVIHLIRDGRDVMLSRAKNKVGHLDDPFNRLLVFGDASVSEYQGRPLTEAVIEEFRNQLEMQFWVSMVRFGMKGRVYKNQYMEVSYEELCRSPAETLNAVFEFLNVPFQPRAKDWITRNASIERIGKWKQCPGDELAGGIRLGEALLVELGYV